VTAYEKLRNDDPRAQPLLLVGVGYGASYRKPQNKRFRDYTPTAMPGEEGTGGAKNFLTFLSATLWTELAGRYALSETERGIAGHSLGSLFALYALFQPKPFFNRALVSSPSVWYDDRSIMKIARELRDRQSVLPARAFLSVGEEDTPSMMGDLTLLEEQLAARPFEQLELAQKRYPNRDHYNAIEPAFEDGLRMLFPPQ
jgi:predicted alpha/beta superfamily hydrolase